MFEKEIQAILPEITAIREDIHRHPELGYKEVRTAKLVADYLRNCGLSVTTGVALTGVVGVLDSHKPGKTLLIRADMDALAIQELADCEYRSQIPGQMHACGHDAHTAMLLGAAKVLSQHRDAFCGKIKFVFQPAEEGIPADMQQAVRDAGYAGNGGAGFMIQEGVLEDVDQVLALHVRAQLPLGKIEISRREASASSDVFDITFVGKGGHGASPHHAIDPVPAIAELITAIHMLPAREIDPSKPCVVSIGLVETPGTTWNVVAEKARIYGGFRTFDDGVRAYVKRRIPELAQAIAEMNRCRMEYSQRTGYAPTLQNEPLALAVCEHFKGLLGSENVLYTEAPHMESEDAGAYFREVPGVFIRLGVGEGEHSYPQHNPYFTMNAPALAAGMGVHINAALYLLNR